MKKTNDMQVANHIFTEDKLLKKERRLSRIFKAEKRSLIFVFFALLFREFIKILFRNKDVDLSAGDGIIPAIMVLWVLTVPLAYVHWIKLKWIFSIKLSRQMSEFSIDHTKTSDK